MNYDRLDELLSKLHMSRRQLAIKAGIKTSTMSMWFVRKQNPIPHDALERIANILNVQTWELTGKMPGIVRCIDCKYNSGNYRGLYAQFVTCYKTGSPHREDWYCADGERK